MVVIAVVVVLVEVEAVMEVVGATEFLKVSTASVCRTREEARRCVPNLYCLLLGGKVDPEEAQSLMGDFSRELQASFP